MARRPIRQIVSAPVDWIVGLWYAARIRIVDLFDRDDGDYYG